MKRIKIVSLALGIGIISAVSWVGITNAQVISSNVGKNKVVDSSIYSSGNTVTIGGTVNGDVYCAGKTVVISGTVNGDVLCAAQDLTIDGTVTGSVRAAAGTLRLTGKVGRGVTLAADQIFVATTAKVGQDATITGNRVETHGLIGRDAIINAGTTYLYGTIGRNTAVHGQTVALKGGAHIGGNLHYTSSRSVSIGDNAAVAGTVSHTKPNESRFHGFGNGLAVIMAVGAIVLALVLVLMWPQFIHETSDVAVRSLGKSILVGAVATVVGPIALAVIGATIIGLPVAILGLLVAVAIVMVSTPIAAYYFGSMLMAKSKNPVAIMSLGIVVLLLVERVPILGALIGVVAYLIGAGALLIRLKRSTPRPVYRVE